MSSNDCPIEFRLEWSNDRSQPYMWQVYTKGGGKSLAYSETYTSRAAAINAVHAVTSGRARYTTFRGSDNQWYFHIQGLNNEILARSSYKFPTQAGATADAELVRRNAADAPFYDYATAA